MQKYFIDNPVGQKRASSFFNTSAGSIDAQNQNLTWGQLSLINAERIIRLARPFAENQTKENLVRLKDDQIVGEWRDSTYGRSEPHACTKNKASNLLYRHRWRPHPVRCQHSPSPSSTALHRRPRPQRRLSKARKLVPARHQIRADLGRQISRLLQSHNPPIQSPRPSRLLQKCLLVRRPRPSHHHHLGRYLPRPRPGRQQQPFQGRSHEHGRLLPPLPPQHHRRHPAHLLPQQLRHQHPPHLPSRPDDLCRHARREPSIRRCTRVRAELDNRRVPRHRHLVLATRHDGQGS